MSETRGTRMGLTAPPPKHAQNVREAKDASDEKTHVATAQAHILPRGFSGCCRGCLLSSAKSSSCCHTPRGPRPPPQTPGLSVPPVPACVRLLSCPNTSVVHPGTRTKPLVLLRPLSCRFTPWCPPCVSPAARLGHLKTRRSAGLGDAGGGTTSVTVLPSSPVICR